MSAALTDKFTYVASAGSVTNLAAPGKVEGASSINITSGTGWPTATGFVFAIRSVDTNGNLISGTYTEWLGTLSDTTIAMNTTPVYGEDQVYAAGSNTQVFIPLSSYAWNSVMAAILEQHNQDGSHGDITATSMASTGAVSGTTGIFSSTGSFGGKLTASAGLQVTGATTTSGSTITPTTQIYDVTALAANATINVPSFTPWNGAPFIIRIVDNGTARTLTFASGYTNQSGLSTPTTTVLGKFLTVAGLYNSSTSKWQIFSITEE